METIRKKIEHLRYQNENAYGRHFVPYGDLLNLMSRENVQKVLEDSTIERHSIDETTKTITKRAVRIFSILVLIGQPECILTFIKADGHRQLCIDDRLPFNLDILRDNFPDDIMARRFHEKQKEFIVPIFDRSALPRDFNGDTILPFLEDHPIGSGGFGNVFKIKISPSHHCYGRSSNWVWRWNIATSTIHNSLMHRGSSSEKNSDRRVQRMISKKSYTTFPCSDCCGTPI